MMWLFSHFPNAYKKTKRAVHANIFTEIISMPLCVDCMLLNIKCHKLKRQYLIYLQAVIHINTLWSLHIERYRQHVCIRVSSHNLAVSCPSSSNSPAPAGRACRECWGIGFFIQIGIIRCVSAGFVHYDISKCKQWLNIKTARNQIRRKKKDFFSRYKC